VKRFSFARWWGIVLKEFLQLKRDRITFGMIVGMPIIQLVLFGYAINADPRHLPTAVVMGDRSEFTRSFLTAMKTTATSRSSRSCPTRRRRAPRSRAARCSSRCTSRRIFTRKLLRGERPALLVEADATDPSATGAAIASLHELAHASGRKTSAGRSLRSPRTRAVRGAPARLYNPEGITQHNIVPG